MYIETTLNYDQKLDLLFVAIDSFGHHDNDDSRPTDWVHEIVDNWVPVYNNHVRDAWIEADCPEPEDYDVEGTGNIHNRMQAGIYYAAVSYLNEVLRDADTIGEAIDTMVQQRDVVENPAKYWQHA